MKKKSITHNDLSKKQLQHLKEIYIQKKVECMGHKELKEFVLEIISHQINDTIGKEEEMEAWMEISKFYGNQFENVILEIQTVLNRDKMVKVSFKEDRQKRIELIELLQNTINSTLIELVGKTATFSLIK